jgi:hypothetical protein
LYTTPFAPLVVFGVIARMAPDPPPITLRDAAEVAVPMDAFPLVVRLDNVPTLVKLDDTTLLASVVPVNVPAAAATVMSAVPLKLTPLMVRAVWSAVAVLAFPVRAAVIVPAAKLPDASRATTFDAVLRAVASTATVTGALPV